MPRPAAMLAPLAVAVALVASFAFAQTQDPAPLVDRFQRGTADERERAARDLLALGEPALAPLRALRDRSQDATLRTRLDALLAELELAHPGGLVLAFTRGEATACELWVWIDGEETRLTHNTQVECEPALAPDGSRLAFARAPHHHDFGAHAIVVRELATGRERTLPNGRCPSWSRDGTLATAHADGIHLHGPGDAPTRTIGKELGAVAHLQWSPNGRFVAAETQKGITVLEAANGAVHAVVPGTPPGTSSLYNFTLGDSRVAMVSGNGPYEWHVYVAPLGDGEPRRVTQHAFRHGMASLAPDEQRVLLLQSTPDHQGYAAYLLELDAEAAEPREVFASASPLLRAQWSPDHRFVVFAGRDETLHLLHVRSGRTRALAKMQVGYGPATTWYAPSVWFAHGRALPRVVGDPAPAAK